MRRTDEEVLIPASHVDAWIDRIGNMVFIADDIGETMNPAYFWAAIADHDRHRGLTEAAVWWM
ncbi:hypothetical protein [Herbaspirillum huttiense]|uniref:Uncharacterized protein n=1 Tax=Herbaspirillum huttiense subsp. lycopersici TaxID=3074428 RepID=A0ABU2EG25_9BURK|nr:hypothetical protein [Herbaspirillum huttiense]MDR9847095.1 hypothetical protein [Herbaspirillum huttiense SE1]